MHTLYDIKTSIPSFIHISSAKVHDVNVMDLLYYEPGGYYIFDRAYINYNRLFKLNKSLAYNAVEIQIYSAIIAYCLVALVRNKLKIDRSTYELKIDEVKFCKY